MSSVWWVADVPVNVTCIYKILSINVYFAQTLNNLPSLLFNYILLFSELDKIRSHYARNNHFKYRLRH